MTTIHWFRRDLRLHDNPSWQHALASSKRVIPVYIHCPSDEGTWRSGAASNWWLHQALADLAQQLAQVGCPLVILKAEHTALEALAGFCQTHQVKQICWNLCCEPAAIKRDATIESSLTSAGIQVTPFNGSLLFDPRKLTNKSGKPYKVFTPFWKHALSLHIPAPERPRLHTPPPHCIKGLSLDTLHLMPRISWYQSIASFWEPTRSGADRLIKAAVKKALPYDSMRDIPADDGTSRLSPYLHFGQISPREFYHTILSQAADKDKATDGILRQLIWREFSAYLLYHYPRSQDHPLKEEYNHFPWQIHPRILECWHRGQTGYPIVDAGMRQLWQTGWMHNRVRMIASSLLVKHLLQPWQEGARWFWDTLVDADLSNNTMGWQWIAGCGADASPYFRIFNPIIQGQKFDPQGTYVKHWIPELKDIPVSHIHTPWELSPLELKAAKVTLGKTYPTPIISHSRGRQKALAAYASFKAR